ncbi:MAG TPA: sodium:solute symporter, partial [Bacillota bacterium]|nr:sodium:solute symporter [Bacillota bacterium]
MTQTIALIVLVLFAIGMVIIGLVSKKRAQSLDGFLLGGRKMGPWVSALAYGTSYFSAVIFIGYAGKHGWDIGLGSLWIGVGNALIAALAAWLVLAKRTRSMTRRLDSRTMPEYFSARYASTGMKVYSAVIIFVFLVPYAAGVYKGLGSMFSTIFPGTPEWTCMLIVAVLTTIYLILGGYVATALNDLIQGIIMIVGIIVMVTVLLCRPEVGGITGMIDKLTAIDPQLTAPFGGSSFNFLAVNIA